MVCHAYELAFQGLKVALIDKNKNLGGAWACHTLSNGFDVELGCHVIEKFPGIYEYFSNTHNIHFVRDQIDPIRAFPSGFVFPYYSRIMLFLSALNLLYGYISCAIAYLLFKKSKDGYINYKQKALWFIKFQLGSFIFPGKIMFPKFGFNQFNKNLISNAKDKGVKFIFTEIESIRLCDNIWKITDKNGNYIKANKVYSTSSINLESHSKSHYKILSNKTYIRKTMVISINTQDTLYLYPYVSFLGYKYLSRISKVSNINPNQEIYYYLVEFKKEAQMIDNQILQKYLKNALIEIRLLKFYGSFNFIDQVSYQITHNKHQLPKGKFDYNFYVLNSKGNLAAGFSQWMLDYKW